MTWRTKAQEVAGRQVAKSLGLSPQQAINYDHYEVVAGEERANVHAKAWALTVEWALATAKTQVPYECILCRGVTWRTYEAWLDSGMPVTCAHCDNDAVAAACRDLDVVLDDGGVDDGVDDGIDSTGGA